MIENLRTLRALWRLLIDPTRDDAATVATAKLIASLDRVYWTPRHQSGPRAELLQLKTPTTKGCR